MAFLPPFSPVRASANPDFVVQCLFMDMMEQLKRQANRLLILVALVGILGLSFACGLKTAPELWTLKAVLESHAGDPLPPLGEVLAYLEREYYGPLPAGPVLTHGAIRGMLETLDDPHAQLIEPQNNVSAVEIFTGKYGDIGADLIWQDGWRLVPYPAGPAAEAGILPGERLWRLDGQDVSAMTQAELKARLSGPVGSQVTLELERGCARYTQSLTRAEVLHPSVLAYRLAPEIGYLRLTQITEGTFEEARQALDNWPELQGLVLDLRGNAGGVVSALPALAGLFLPEGKTLYYEIRRTGTRPIQVQGDEGPFTGKLIVLIDPQTASAAEILASALQAYQRTELFGQASAGKASMQIAYPLADGATIVLTNALWEDPLHRSVAPQGITPDRVLAPEPAGQEDPVLQAALEALPAP